MYEKNIYLYCFKHLSNYAISNRIKKKKSLSTVINKYFKIRNKAELIKPMQYLL